VNYVKVKGNNLIQNVSNSSMTIFNSSKVTFYVNINTNHHRNNDDEGTKGFVSLGSVSMGLGNMHANHSIHNCSGDLVAHITFFSAEYPTIHTISPNIVTVIKARHGQDLFLSYGAWQGATKTLNFLLDGHITHYSLHSQISFGIQNSAIIKLMSVIRIENYSSSSGGNKRCLITGVTQDCSNLCYISSKWQSCPEKNNTVEESSSTGSGSSSGSVGFNSGKSSSGTSTGSISPPSSSSASSLIGQGSLSGNAVSTTSYSMASGIGSGAYVHASSIGSGWTTSASESDFGSFSSPGSSSPASSSGSGSGSLSSNPVSSTSGIASSSGRGSGLNLFTCGGLSYLDPNACGSNGTCTSQNVCSCQYPYRAIFQLTCNATCAVDMCFGVLVWIVSYM